MKKTALSLISILLVFAVIGCNWEMPKALQVSGTIGIDNLSINLDLTQFITKELEKKNQWTSSFEVGEESYDMTITLQEAVNVGNPLTFLLHLNIPFPVPFNLDEQLDDLIELYADGPIDDFINNYLDDFLEDLLSSGNAVANNELTDEAKQKIRDMLDSDDIEETINTIIETIQNDLDSDFPDDILILLPDFAGLLAGSADDVLDSIANSIIDNINARLKESGPSLSIMGSGVLFSVEGDEDLKDLLKDAIVDTIKNETKDAVKEKIYTETVEVNDDGSGEGWVLFNEEIPFPVNNLPEFLQDMDFIIPGLAAKVFFAVKENGAHSSYLLNIIDLDLELFETEIIGSSTPVVSQNSGLVFNNHKYNGAGLPAGGITFNISDLMSELFSSDEEKGGFSFKAVIPQGTMLSLGELGKQYDFNLEVVLWLPLKIQADEDIEFILTPEDLKVSEDNDLFGRGDSDTLEEFIQSANFTIRFNKALFNGVKLVIEDANDPDGLKMDFGIITGRDFGINLTNQQIKMLDQTNPFVPQIRLTMKAGDWFAIQRDLKIESLTLKADINIRHNF
ncbi:MAG: hypothetical protein LBU88_11145 [Treponema sp.]|jgi:hypothetical protein|nr:hypothetical protein [Treponema sp.]